MKKSFTLLFFFFLVISIVAQVEIPTSDLTGKYKYSTTNLNSFGIHDPSVVWDSNTKYFYVYGSHYSGAKTKDFRTWSPISKYYKGGYDSPNAYKAFKSCPTHTVKRCLPGKSNVEEVTLQSYDAGTFCSIYSQDGVGPWVSGDQWAPDIVYNPNTKKWNYYLSLNGDNWASVIVLMTGDSPSGPFTYEAPIVFGGFNNQSYDVNGTKKKVNYKDTDLELVLGNLSSLPGRYNTNRWGSFWPNCIDPCVFFDEEGEMWLSYGSWSGGIWMLKLDKNTGLRDYTSTYSGTASSVSSQQTSDAYFGKLIAGGAYVSGEGSYIQHIGEYYYLFMSYGFFSPDGGYEMRVFRSEKPTGPYVDANGEDAINKTYVMNYGPKAVTNKGMKIIGSYNGWGTQTLGECAQGHNSACQDDEGRSFLVCHTKFTDGTAAHAMRIHQLFLNKNGWLCTAPFQFNGETWNDEKISTSQPWSASDIEGDYQLLVHPYKLDYENLAVATPKSIHLSADGKVNGAFTGTWKYTDEGKSYFQIKLGSVTYNGVVSEQTIQGSTSGYRNNSSTAKALCFTAVCDTKGNASCGVPVWGYKMQPQYAIAYNYQNNTDYFKATTFSSISKNVDMMFNTTENVELNWKSTEPDVVSETGKYNPKDEDVKLTLTATLSCGNYYWTRDFNATAKAGGEVLGDQKTGLVAYYNFDGKPTANLYNDTEKITYSKVGSGVAPVLEEDWSRFGQVVHQTFGAQGSNSYSRMPNPLLGQNMDGFTVSMWVKRTDENAYDALWSFFSQMSSAAKDARFFLTGNAYLAYNDNGGDAANWFDINHPDTKKTTLIKPKEWHLVTVTVSKDNGCTLYVDGVSKIKKTSTVNCSYNGSATKDVFDYGKVVSFVSSAKYFYLGLGSFWGSADASFDDLMIYNRELTADDVKGLSALLNRVNDFSPSATSISEVLEHAASSANQAIYDLQGRKVMNPSRGIYIINGKKIYMK